jgi:hypothetical protein
VSKRSVDTLHNMYYQTYYPRVLEEKLGPTPTPQGKIQVPKVGGSLFQIAKSLIALYRFLISAAKSDPLKGAKSDGADNKKERTVEAP